MAGEKEIEVYRCAPNGNFIHHLNIQANFSVWGMCVDNSGHIIATDYHTGVYVFQPSGECVGHVSSDVISQPTGVTVDEDGFVYVCSCANAGSVVVV